MISLLRRHSSSKKGARSRLYFDKGGKIETFVRGSILWRYQMLQVPALRIIKIEQRARSLVPDKTLSRSSEAGGYSWFGKENSIKNKQLLMDDD